MLISFSVANFRSFKEKQTIDLRTIKKFHSAKNFANNYFDSKLKNTGELLKSSAIYGANASGKSNLIKAVYVFNIMALNLENEMNSRKRNESIKHYEPFALDEDFKKKPTEFEIDFIAEKTRYRFSFGYDNNKIHYEKLEFLKENSASDNFKLIYYWQFDKNDQLSTNFTNEFQGNKDRSLEILKNTQNNLFLFLNVNEDGNKFLNPIYDWIGEKLFIAFSHNNFNKTKLWIMKDPKNKKITLDLIKKFDLGIKDFKIEEIEIPIYFKDIEASKTEKEKFRKETFTRVFFFAKTNHKLNESQISLGTKAIFSMASQIFPVLIDGGILFFDELDSSLHPDILLEVIKMFHNPKINIGNGQIIFTIHNDILLDKEYKIFRRDQVWFASKDQQTHDSFLYSLAEFTSETITAKDNIVDLYRANHFGARPLIRMQK
jgi:hypothetical protein